MYDIIGDIHGHVEPLKKLLKILGYTEKNGAWQHSERKVIFVGDYIDRGPAIRETLHIVKSMTDNGSAIALMGNHEYNALAYHHQVNGIPLRVHNKNNMHQHGETLAQFQDYDKEWQMYLEWFYTLPLFFEDGSIRVVHACWDDECIKWLKKNRTDNNHDDSFIRLNVELLEASHVKSSEAFNVINDLLKGKEIDIPEHYAWPDKDGHYRTSNRTKWWVDPSNNSYCNWLFDCPSEMKDLRIDSGIKHFVYPQDAPPVFFGHYWMNDKYPIIQQKNIVCLDYSVAKNGYLVSYRWEGEKELNPQHFTLVL